MESTIVSPGASPPGVAGRSGAASRDAPISEAGFFFAMSLACVVVAFVGFTPTFWRPLAEGTLHVKPIVYIHGGLFFSWTIFLAVQSWLVLRRNLRWHRSLGMAGISLATLVTTSGVLVTLNLAATVAPLGLLETIAPDMIFPVIGFPTFAVLVVMAFAYVRRTDYHKRYMLLATISALDAPVARWILFGDHERAGFNEGMVASLVFEVMIAALVIYDWRFRGRIHPAYLIGASIIIVGQILRGVLGESALWAGEIHWLTTVL